MYVVRIFFPLVINKQFDWFMGTCGAPLTTAKLSNRANAKKKKKKKKTCTRANHKIGTFHFVCWYYCCHKEAFLNNGEVEALRGYIV